jgi:hypothetical protein
MNPVIAAIAFIAVLAGAALLTWLTRNTERKPRCCQPGLWPPDDITERR